MVSIIMPCFNAEPTLMETMSSIFKQNDGNWEVIAVDDGSTDNTLSLLQELQNKDNRVRIVQQENNGVSSARNNGIAHSRGDWIYFLDSDDIIDESLISIINSLDSNTEMIVFDFVEKGSKRTRTHKISNINTLFSDYLINRQTVHISSMAIKSHILLSHNIVFDENTYYGEDRELIANLFKLRPNIEHINKVLFTYMYRDGSAMTNKVYSKKRFSSVVASERTYHSLIGCPEEIYAHIILGFTIARHLKMYYGFKCTDMGLKNKLWEYSNQYLKSCYYLGISKIEAYTCVASILSHFKILFKIFLKFC